MCIHSKKPFFPFVAALLLFVSQSALAEVTADVAEQLKRSLTPFGAERSGNADGAIPSWEGGISEPVNGFKGGKDLHPDPYADDQILFTITAQNMNQYADKLAEGQVALLKKFPGTYKLHVYQTRRSHAAPQWVYDNTYANALRAKTNEDGTVLSDAYAGIPFPIPQTGSEAIWNHLLRWQGQAYELEYTSYTVFDNGTKVKGGGLDWEKYPYYDPNGNLESFNGDFWYLLVQYKEPARRNGEMILLQDPVNQSIEPRRAWQYIPGQRRVRRAPLIAYDTPNAQFSGVINYDDTFMFNGGIDRYDWKLIGKKEMYVPYNNYKADSAEATSDNLLTAGHVNPEFMRWELHRVWEVEATLKDGKRHNYGRRVMYLDEDSWAALLVNNYDVRGNLWRSHVGPNKNHSELPGVILTKHIHYDLISGAYAVNGMAHNDPGTYRSFYEGEKDSFFTPSQVRKLSRR